nr:hypothetical protein Iba_chr10aCG0040 [Ipomoea batatas]GMD41606.1 hypothetical protein Iba_chr10bCG1310 [Ipomoea batatas]
MADNDPKEQERVETRWDKTVLTSSNIGASQEWGLGSTHHDARITTRNKTRSQAHSPELRDEIRILASSKSSITHKEKEIDMTSQIK